MRSSNEDPPVGPAQLTNGIGNHAGKSLVRVVPFAACVVVFISLCFLSPFFSTPENLSSLARQSAVLGILAVGMTPIMISGGVDLSFGSVMGLGGTCGALLLQTGVPLATAVIAAIGVGAVCGLANGLLIAFIRIKPFVATFGMFAVAPGIALALSGGLPIANMPDSLRGIYHENLFHILPVPVAILVPLAFGVALLLQYARWGNSFINIGTNSQDGSPWISHRLNLVAIYFVGGAFAGLAGMMEASRAMVGQPTAGQGYEVSVIAAVVFGGASFIGGEGGIVGSLSGAFLVGTIFDGGNLLGVPVFWQQVIAGALLLLAAAIDNYRRRGRVSTP